MNANHLMLVVKAGNEAAKALKSVKAQDIQIAVQNDLAAFR